ncbi:1099_t:CDS:2, partial [Scutellospora calospora]
MTILERKALREENSALRFQVALLEERLEYLKSRKDKRKKNSFLP